MKTAVILLVALAAIPLLAGNNTWTSTGPGGRNVSLALDPFDPNRLYAVSDSVVWRSTDRSSTWERLSTFPTDAGLLALDPRNPLHLLVTGAGWNDPHVYESIDGGSTWIAHSVGTVLSVGRIAFGGDGRTVYVSGGWDCFLFCSGGGVFRSADSGKTFSPAGLQGQPISSLVVDQTNPDVVYASFTDGKPAAGVQKTTQGGRSWSNIGPSSPITSIAIDPVVSSNIIAVSQSQGLSISHDGGRTWTAHLGSSLKSPLGIVACAVFNPAAHSTIYASMPSATCTGCPPGGLPPDFLFGIVRSVDGGDTWLRVIDVSPPQHEGILHIEASGKRIYVENQSTTYEYTFAAEVPRRRAAQH